MRTFSAPPNSAIKPAPTYEPNGMPPSSLNAPPRKPADSNLLNADLIERTSEVVLYIALSLAELGCDVPEWRAVVREYWGIQNLDSRKLASPANLQATHQAVAELVQILLVEGGLLFGLADFQSMDRVRNVVELTMQIQRACEVALQKTASAKP